MIASDFLNAGTAQTIVKATYAGALCYGLFSDIKSLQIPNAVPLIIFATFFPYYWLGNPQEGLQSHLLAALIGVLVTFGIYAAGLMGAGDVKLIAALLLWAGIRDGLTFVFIMSLIGGLFAGLLLIARWTMAAWPTAERYIPSRRLRGWAKRGIFPYGIAICIAGLILIPSFFSSR